MPPKSSDKFPYFSKMVKNHQSKLFSMCKNFRNRKYTYFKSRKVNALEFLFFLAYRVTFQIMQNHKKALKCTQKSHKKHIRQKLYYLCIICGLIILIGNIIVCNIFVVVFVKDG